MKTPFRKKRGFLFAIEKKQPDELRKKRQTAFSPRIQTISKNKDTQ